MKKKSIHILLPPVWGGIYIQVARLLKAALCDMGYGVIISDAVATTADLRIVLGWHLFRGAVPTGIPYIVYQLEPLTQPLWTDKFRASEPVFKRACMLWDYCHSNSVFLHELGYRTTLIPLGYHEQQEVLPAREMADYDVLFVGFVTERRKHILRELQQHCSVSVGPKWGSDFDNALWRSKILLNIHQYDLPTPLEQARVAYALNNNCFVISEYASDTPYPELVQCHYHELVQTVLYYLYHPLQREQRQAKSVAAFKCRHMQLPAAALEELVPPSEIEKVDL